MRARLEKMDPIQEFRFLADPKMAEKMPRVAVNAGGEIVEQDERPYGVVILVRKK